MTGIEEYLGEKAKLVNAEFETILSKKPSERYIEILLGRAGYKYDTDAFKKSILDPAWYLLGSGGKRWRPVLGMLVLEALGKNPLNYLEFLIVPEVIHNATLIHDDIEDNSDVRRGMPAVHKNFGLDVALNVGDFMYFFPMRALTDSKKLTQRQKNLILSFYVKELTRVTLGQSVDIAWHRGLIVPETIIEDKYMQMNHDKTGSLARLACEIAGVLGGANKKTIEALAEFGATIGVAFQLQDDLLNIYESGVSKSKGGVGDDISEGKITLIVIYTIQHASESDKKRLLEILSMHTKDKERIDEAIAILQKYNGKEYIADLQHKLIKKAWTKIDKKLPESEAKSRLKELADFVGISRAK